MIKQITVEELEDYIYEKTRYFVPESVLRAMVDLLNQQKEDNATKHDNQRNPD